MEAWPLKLRAPPSTTVRPRDSVFLLRISRSRIDRFGVFADEDIPPRRKVIEYTGERITIREADRRFRKILHSRKPKRFYLFGLEGRWVIDGSVSGSGAELINHGCDPNLVQRRVRGHILYFSRRRIRRGEELTVDYHFPQETVIVLCRCGSPKCRGTINLK
jgi:SET domain-containing protein